MSDDEHVAMLVKILDQVDGWLARTDSEAPRPCPGARSALHGDDQRTKPYHVSHAAWHSLTHAVDHLHCLRTLIRDAQILHMYAPYTVLRAALENASAAVWLLAPRRRQVRMLRRLRLAALDIHHGDQIQEAMGLTPRRTAEERRNDLRAIAGRLGIAEGEALRRPGYAEIVETAGNEIDRLGATLPMAAWRACSGIAHGDFWATVSVTARTELGPPTDGIVTNKITANVEGLRYVLSITSAMTNDGWRLYDERSRSPY